MNLAPLRGPGSTPARRRFWDDAWSAVVASQKIAGRHVIVDEHPGKGSVINVDDTSARRPGPPTPTGACCTDGTCSITTSTTCVGGGGNYLGDGTTCDSVDCTQGACCHDDGTCSIESESDCLSAGGIYQGDGTICIPNPCGSCATLTCYPTNISVTATPNGEIGVRGECEIIPPGRVTLTGSPILILDEGVSLNGASACCVGGGNGLVNLPVDGGTNEACCGAFGYPAYAVFGWIFQVEWCPDEMQWKVCATLSIGGGLTGYCNWPPVGHSFFPDGELDCFSNISAGQTTVSLTLVSSDWSFLTFDVQIALTWVGC